MFADSPQYEELLVKIWMVKCQTIKKMCCKVWEKGVIEEA